MKSVIASQPRSASGIHSLSRIGLASVLCLGLTLAGIGVPSALGVEIDKGWLYGRLDTTIAVGASMRLVQPDLDLIGVANGGYANSINLDDGNLNFKKGDLTSASIRVTHELDLSSGNFGFFGRMYYFYDWAIMSIDTERTPLSKSAERYAGKNIKILDAYLTTDFDLFGRPVTMRVGNQVLSWGESLFIQNGINSINPIDVSQVWVAGAELRDALLPIPMVSLNAGITDNLSIEGFYQLYWNNTEIEPSGTFFCTKDHVGPGADRVYLGFGQPGVSDNPPTAIGSVPPSGVAVFRQPDNRPPDEGQGGVALRYFAPWLNDTEFGFYYMRYHSRLPVLSGMTGIAPPDDLDAYLEWALTNGDYASTGGYFREYPKDIDLVGMSFNTEVGSSGIALQGEVTYRMNQPFQVDDVELLVSALQPLEGALGPLLYLSKYPDADPDLGVFSQSQLIQQGGAVDYEQYIRGWRRKDMIQPQFTLTKLFGPMLGMDQLVMLAEFGATYILDMEDKNELRYEADGTFTSANDYFTQIGLQPATQPMRDFPDEFSWGYRLAARADFNNAVGPVTLQPAVAFYHDVEGTTPAPVTNFIEERKSITGSLTATYLNALRVKVSYTNYFDGGNFNLIEDRDFASLAVSYSF